MQNGIAHNGLILLWRMREGKHLCPGKTTLSDHAVLYLPVPHISRKRITPGCTRCHTRPVTSVNQNGFISQVADICYVPLRGHIRFCGLNAWGCQKRSVVWLSHSSNVMASVSFIWMPALNVCRTSPLSTGNQKQHEIINHGNRTGYSDCVAAGQYRLRIGNYL